EAHAHILWGGGLEITDNKLTPASTSTIGAWYDNYQIIQHINIFFDYYEKGKFSVSAAKVNLWLAEMHFLRAYCYNQMIKAYGGVVITKEAMAGRLSRGAALGLKAQVLLHAASPLHNPTNDKAKWTAAAEAAKAVIDLPQYRLYNPVDYRNIFFHKKSQGNTEIILSKHARANSGEVIFWFNFPSTLFGPPSFGGWGLAAPIQEFVDAFQMADGTPYDRTKHGAAPYQNREKRFYASILYDGAEYSRTMPQI
ncbi:RagB/SusD family nutrient uptake outer membrane protein, partial [bacterium]|nr:RagB/SusD family nutrient uptake outer membrane protein [bacterium]